MDAAIDGARDDLRLAMRARGVAKNIRHQQRRIHHQAEHDGRPPSFPWRCARPFRWVCWRLAKMLTGTNQTYKQSSRFILKSPPSPLGAGPNSFKGLFCCEREAIVFQVGL